MEIKIEVSNGRLMVAGAVRFGPPIAGTTHTLPLDNLSPRDFERLCLWLVERGGEYERAEHLGAASSEQGSDVRLN